MIHPHQKNTLGYTPEEYRKFKKHALSFLIFFSVLYSTTYCIRGNLSAVGPKMMAELNWTNREIGILSGILMWTYAVGQLVSGRLSEIIGSTKCLILSVVLSASANIIAGFQTNFTAIAVLWGLNGLFQSLAWAPGFAALTRWWPSTSRGFATGFANAFAGFGTAAAQIAVVFALRALPGFGWRAAFFVPAAFPVIMLVLFLIFTRSSPKKIGLNDYAEENTEEDAHEREMQEIVKTHGVFYPFKYVLTNRGFAVWLLVSFLVGVARYGLIDWVPKYFSEVYNLDVTNGLIRSLILPVGMGIGTLVLPTLTDVVWKNNRIYHVILSAVIGAAAVGVFTLLDPRVPAQLVLIEILLFLAGFFVYAISGISLVVAADVGGRVFSGTAAGILNFVSYMGSACQAVVYGSLVDKMGWNVVFVSIAVFCTVVAAISVLTAVRGKKSRITE